MKEPWVIEQSRFHGGIHPPEQKEVSNRKPLQNLPLPKEVVLPLGTSPEHLAEPLVELGQQVKVGQLLARNSNAKNASVHASISGEIVAIEPRPVPHIAGLLLPSIVIKGDGLDEFIDCTSFPNWQAASHEELLVSIQSSGLVGLGGAVFPTATKLEGALSQSIHTLVINACECEPYITADDLLMRSRPQALLEGIGILHQLLQPEQLLLGIEDNKPEALSAIKDALPGSPVEKELQICVLPTRYPSGGEKQLIQLLTGQEVPSGGLPLDIGVLCQNVGTLAALADAVVRGQPLIERIVTVTGQAINHPGNYLVRLGTCVEELLHQAGWNAQQSNRVIMGGPMMGMSLANTQVPVTQAMNCLLVPTAEELPLPGQEQPCIRCGRCEEACPAQLLPQQLYFYAANQAWKQAEDHQLFDCIECGACAWVCPSEIPLVQYYRYAKGEIRQLQADAEKAEQARLRFEARQERFAREAKEKEAKRKARAEAAARVAASKKAQTSAPDTQTTTAAEADASHAKKLKQLKVAKAAAGAALKKAEKSLNNLQASSDATADQITEQQQRLAAAKQQLAKAEEKLIAAEEG